MSIIWPENLGTDHQQYLFGKLSEAIVAVGKQQLYPQGNPIYPLGFDAKQWVVDRFMAAKNVIHTWDQAVCGPAKNSKISGEQEDQIFVRGEAFFEDGHGAEYVAYLSALKLMNRPCHHLENNGSQADPDNHYNCEFWWGRPHFAAPDRLGKEQPIDQESSITYGWLGPDDEHWLYNTVFAAARLTGSPALQWELEQQARIFLFQETLPSQPYKQNWFTTSPRSARSVGYACLLAVYLYENLEDRALAERVRVRIIARIKEVYVPILGPRPIWDPRMDAPSLGPGLRWMPWQQAVGAYGLHIASDYFNVLEGVPVALAAAKKVLLDAVIHVSGRWRTMNVQMADGTSLDQAEDTFWWFGFPLAAATVLHYEPGDLRTVSIWTQMKTETYMGNRTSWMDPGIWERNLPEF